MRVLYILIAILAIRFILNLSKYIRTKKYHDLYVEWLVVTRSTKPIEMRSQVVGLLKDAGVKDSFVGTVQPMGYGYIGTGNTSVMDNFPNARQDIATLTNAMFLQALGTYRSRMIDTFNPLRWIEWLIHLPRYTLRYLGVSADGAITKLAQIIWWIVGALVGFSFALYRPEVESMIKGWIGKLR
jgi:hypothetical protein